MAEEVGSFTPEYEVEGSKRSRIRCIILCVTLIVIVGLIAIIGIALTYATDAPALLVHPTDVVVVTVGDTKAEEEYLSGINSFASIYSGEEKNVNLKKCSDGVDKGDGQCVFEMSWLASPCTKAENWGYNEWKPCILLSLNGPRDWIPEPYTHPGQLPEEMPTSLRRHIEDAFKNDQPTEFLWVSCSGQFPADEEFLGETVLSPWQGFPTYYFPLRHDTSQLATPVLSLQLPNAESYVVISIYCHFWAKNIQPPYKAAHIEYLST